MSFNSLQFLIFFPIVALIFYILPKKVRYIWLLVASYYFYMCWNVAYAGLIAISTVVTFGSGLLLEKFNEDTGKKKLVVAGSFTINLGILFFFKYLDFFFENINSLLGIMKVRPINSGLDLLLPVGISFYTFQALSYTMDVYRGEVKAMKNPFKYALFVSFFPQLVAGPIERSKNLLTQIETLPERKSWNYERVLSGIYQMAFGMFMKMVIADRVAIFVDGVYSRLHYAGTFETVFAALGFSLQIYCDFAGYSAIAIGAARILGFDLMENFNTPYFAGSIGEFWRRWHISLSTWFKDYLYIPLGGNRKGKLRKYINLIIVFLVSGLWHGASWTFVIWGGIHGLLQVIEDVILPRLNALYEKFGINTKTESFKLFRMIKTGILVTLAWVFFKADSLSQAIKFLTRMFTKWNPWVIFDGTFFKYGINQIEFRILIIGVVILLLADLIRYFKKEDIGVFIGRQNYLFRWIVLLTLIFMCIVFGKYGADFDSAEFIYFKF